MVIYGVSEKYYGWIFAVIAGGLISASQLNNFLLKKYRSEQIIKAALYFQNIIGIILVGTVILGMHQLYLTILLIMLFLCCQGFIFPNASALSMAPFAQNAGSASALMGFIQMSVGALMSAMVSILQNGTAIPMTAVMAICSVSASLLYAVGKRRVINHASKILVEEEDVEMISTL
jgi:DHA1 family bicyclomycin/chloramphenicol resistance-like MFS transporter